MIVSTGSERNPTRVDENRYFLSEYPVARVRVAVTHTGFRPILTVEPGETFENELAEFRFPVGVVNSRFHGRGETDETQIAEQR